jgi:phosphatidylserine decarboxylase
VARAPGQYDADASALQADADVLTENVRAMLCIGARGSGDMLIVAVGAAYNGSVQ